MVCGSGSPHGGRTDWLEGAHGFELALEHSPLGGLGGC